MAKNEKIGILDQIKRKKNAKVLIRDIHLVKLLQQNQCFSTVDFPSYSVT